MPTPEYTPGGCKRDNYRALIAAGLRDDDPTGCYVQFQDFYCYRMSPTTPAEFRVKVLENEDPGCWLNKVLMRRPTYTYTRLGGLPPLNQGRVWKG